MISLSFMGVCDPEPTRCRVYGSPLDEERRADFIRRLATVGVLDCPAYDGWIDALKVRGWVPSEPDYEPANCGGRYARWRLTPAGLVALRDIVNAVGGR